VLESSLAVHIQGATADVPNRGQFASREPLLVRVDRGLYRRAAHLSRPVMQESPLGEPMPSTVTEAEDGLAAVLVGCVKTKQSVPAKPLTYTGRSFFVAAEPTQSLVACPGS
jgi:hypothetical protein